MGLKVVNLGLLEGGYLLENINKELEVMASDCAIREHVAGKRELTLKITIEPKLVPMSGGHMINKPEFTTSISRKLPTLKTGIKTVGMVKTINGRPTVMVSDSAPEDPNQVTLDDMQAGLGSGGARVEKLN